MAVYNIFASADATIYSRYPVKNAGLDSILEVSAKNSQDGTNFLYRNPITENPYYNYDLAAAGNYSTSDAYFPGSDVRRSVLQFSSSDIAKLKTFASQSISSSYEANLRLSLASAQNLNTTYSLEAYALTQSWTMGTGRYAQEPESTNGVSWAYTGPSGSSALWTTGGGSWNRVLTGSQYFDYMDNKDVNMNVTDILNNWFTGSVKNRGLIVKHPTNVESNPDAFVDLKFFSVDTHTIYPPTIQFKWDDSYYYPQGTNFVLTNQVTVTLANNPGQFTQNEVYKMRISTRYTYPPRQFTTSSVYLTNLILSERTCWGLQDVKTGEMIVDFDEDYTKLSCDSVGNYLTLYTSGLQINRYYRLLIKTNIFSTTFGPLSIYDNDQSIYDALSLYAADDLKLLPAEEAVYGGQNLTFKIVG